MKLDVMKLFRNLFGNTRTSESGSEQELKEDSNNLFVNPELFLDQNHPEKTLIESNPTQIQKFVEKNLELEGYKQGFDMACKDFLENKLMEIKNEFRYLIDQEIDFKKSELFNLKNNLIEIGDLSEPLSEKLKLRIERTMEIISQLEHQKELSVSDEGWVMKPLRSYKRGYVKGFEAFYDAPDWMLENQLFNPKTKLSC